MASSQVNELIQLIKTNQKSTPIYIPSLKRDVKFRHLTAGQQEKFVQALIENPALQPRFTQTLIDVIRENCEESSIVSSFTTIDKYAIGIGLRCSSIGSSLKTEVDNEPGVTYTIDLNSIIDTIKRTPMPVLDPVVVDEYTLDIQYPTVTQELVHDKYFKRHEIGSEESADAFRSFLSNAFISDAIMFIKQLSITKDGKNVVSVDFNKLQIQDKAEIVRKLPSNVLEGLLDPMSTVKNVVEAFLRGTGVMETDSNVKRGILITFDASLFMIAS